MGFGEIASFNLEFTYVSNNKFLLGNCCMQFPFAMAVKFRAIYFLTTLQINVRMIN